MAEVRACLQMVVVVEDLGFKNLVVEEESLTVIKKIQTFEEDKSNIPIGEPHGAHYGGGREMMGFTKDLD
ncbi:hypothetical protein J1N35_034772 [Gossypium stocksii]|uniref:RNase H type-1 domain-containing protein n=1 Tax=Gossypium stocksii TaxID=47602 RepID=A0A9D3ZQV4_9ROSI|nr:hypothetical protein J1N35_034772 [Gossypium stocksii]